MLQKILELPNMCSAYCWTEHSFKWTISFTKSKAISVLPVTESFKTIFKIDLASSFASDVVFCCWKKLRIAFFCVYFDTVPFHLPRDAIFKQWSFRHARCLLKSINGTVNVFSSASAIEWQLWMRRTPQKTRYPYTKICLLTYFFCLHMSTRSINFKCVNYFFIGYLRLFVSLCSLLKLDNHL